MEREIEGGYTPGPWVLSQPIIRGVTTMYWVNVNTSIGSNKLEDVRLIAAAPELLEALQWAMSELRGDTRYTDPQQALNCFDLADAVIAKALGTGDVA